MNYPSEELQVSSAVADSVRCVLCGSGGVQTVDQFRFSDLRHLYFETCEVDIAECLDAPYKEELVYLYRCDECGLEFYPPGLCGNQKLYDALNKFDYYYMKDKWEFGIALQEIKSSYDILEVGCGPGLFLDRVIGTYPEKRVKGLELNADSVRICRGKGLEVEERTIEDFSAVGANTFDAVCAFQVLEHVQNPGMFLELAFRCLKREGLCVITVPNARGFTQYAVNDFGNMPPHHLTRWTADVIRRVAAINGTTIERIVEEPVADYHKEWYRDTLTVRGVSTSLGLRWGRIERRTPYRLMLSLCRRLQKTVPAWLWRYSRYPGHTLYVSFRKISKR